MTSDRSLPAVVWWDPAAGRVRARIGRWEGWLTRSGAPEHVYRLPKVTGIRRWHRPVPGCYTLRDGRRVALYASGWDGNRLLEAIDEVQRTGGRVRTRLPWIEADPRGGPGPRKGD